MYDWVLKKKGIPINSSDSSVQGVKKDNLRKSDDKLQLNSGQINNNNNNNNNINSGNNKEMSNNNLKDMKKKNSLENF